MIFSSSVFFDQATIDAWIAEDAPLLDLTTHLLAIGDQPARICFTVRGDGVAACTEEAARILQQCGGEVQQLLPSASRYPAGDVLLTATGAAGMRRREDRLPAGTECARRVGSAARPAARGSRGARPRADW